MLNLIKILAALFIVLGAGIALLRTYDPENGGGGTQFTLFKDLPGDEHERKPKKEERGPAGLVIDHRQGALLVLPWENGGPVPVDVTERELRRCPRDARFPDCL